MDTIQHDMFKEHSWGRDCPGENLNKGWEKVSQRNSGNREMVGWVQNHLECSSLKT